MDKSMLQMFRYFVAERDNVRMMRELGEPRPWTKDPILQHYHFCNIRREDDRGTKEIRAAVQDVAYAALPHVYTAARMFNKASTLERLLVNWDFEALKELRKSEPIFHTAYVVSTCGRAMDKVDYCKEVINAVHVANIPDTTCEAAYEALLQVNGLGTFMAAQVVADLKNDRYLVNASDWKTFSSMGPGSKKGMDFIFEGGTTHRNWDSRLCQLANLLPEFDLHMQDLQNCLCEFSKYVRYIHNLKGRQRPYGIQ